MFGHAFKHTSKFFGTHFTQMNPNTATRLLNSNQINKSLNSISKCISSLDLIPLAIQGLQLNPLLGDSSLLSPKEDLLKEAQKALLESDYLETQGLLSKPLIGSVTNIRLIDELSMIQITTSTTWGQVPKF